ncbi:MAG TPA: phosphatase PAP2 family protein [Polyangiaceae bacterium]|nr:phosphatase PAP2 family protein [Polyangiaceae bacterium]
MNSKSSSRLLFGLAALAAAGFAATTVAVARGMTSKLDQRAKRRLHETRDKSDRAGALRTGALATTPLGKWWGYAPPSLWTALRLQRRGRTAGAATIAATTVLAALLPPLLDRSLRRRLPPPERGEPDEQSFPSGHALQSSAMALTTGYVLYREGLGPRWTSAPLGLASLLTGAGRLLLDRHWSSDVVGGYLAGLALGGTTAGVYELARAR